MWCSRRNVKFQANPLIWLKDCTWTFIWYNGRYWPQLLKIIIICGDSSKMSLNSNISYFYFSTWCYSQFNELHFAQNSIKLDMSFQSCDPLKGCQNNRKQKDLLVFGSPNQYLQSPTHFAWSYYIFLTWGAVCCIECSREFILYCTLHCIAAALPIFIPHLKLKLLLYLNAANGAETEIQALQLIAMQMQWSINIPLYW